ASTISQIDVEIPFLPSRFRCNPTDEDRSVGEPPELPKDFETMLVRAKVRDASPAQDGSGKKRTIRCALARFPVMFAVWARVSGMRPSCPPKTRDNLASQWRAAASPRPDLPN